MYYWDICRGTCVPYNILEIYKYAIRCGKRKVYAYVCEHIADYCRKYTILKIAGYIYAYIHLCVYIDITRYIYLYSYTCMDVCKALAYLVALQLFKVILCLKKVRKWIVERDQHYVSMPILQCSVYSGMCLKMLFVA